MTSTLDPIVKFTIWFGDNSISTYATTVIYSTTVDKFMTENINTVSQTIFNEFKRLKSLYETLDNEEKNKIINRNFSSEEEKKEWLNFYSLFNTHLKKTSTKPFENLSQFQVEIDNGQIIILPEFKIQKDIHLIVKYRCPDALSQWFSDISEY